MRRLLLWQYMLNKRLLHKREFLVLLCLIPFLVVGMTVFSKEDSGVVTVVLSTEDPSDTLVRQVMEEMIAEDSIIKYKKVTMEEAYQQVEAGKANCAWIFREDFQSKLISTFDGGGEEDKPVLVVTQEDNVALQLARTKLYGYIFPHLAFLLCENYLETEVMDGQEVPAEELLAVFEANAVEGGLVDVVYVSADELQDFSQLSDNKQQQKVSYLVTPIRGLLMVLMIIAGLVVTMFYLQDGEKGMFAWIPIPKRRGVLYCYILGAVFDTGMVAILSLIISEGKLLSLRELGAFILYFPMTAIFCEFVGILCRKKEILAKCIPLLSIAMLGLCPIFINLGRGFVPQYFFPPTYCLRITNDFKMIFAMLGYSIVLFAAGTIYHKLAEVKS